MGKYLPNSNNPTLSIPVRTFSDRNSSLFDCGPMISKIVVVVAMLDASDLWRLLTPAHTVYILLRREMD